MSYKAKMTIEISKEKYFEIWGEVARTLLVKKLENYPNSWLVSAQCKTKTASRIVLKEEEAKDFPNLIEWFIANDFIEQNKNNTKIWSLEKIKY